MGIYLTWFVAGMGVAFALAIALDWLTGGEDE